MMPADFIAAIAPAAQASAAKSGVPASFAVAQGALESTWGASKLARFGFNLFGVKADPSWKGPVLALSTHEYIDGHEVSVLARWRQYADWQGSIDDHAAFLRKNPRYAAAFAGARTGEDFARQVAAAGYATDPDYLRKVVSVMRAHNLAALDAVPANS